ncbi:putative endonuclease LCL3 [Dictyocoela muelleri]|nr:putative endonuclease LCL3 [Dictyocoela muelleri]
MNYEKIIKDNILYIVLAFSLITIICYIIYRIRIRIVSIDMLPRNCYGIKLSGIATYVGDGDNFRFLHVPFLRSADFSRNTRTLSIRLYGIDAPEKSYFGKPAQPLSNEAQAALSNLILLKNVTIKILKVDRFSRVIAKVYVGWLFKTDVSLKMLEMGWACVYEGSDAVFDGNETVLREKESIAQKNKIGIWSLENYESPRDYKNKMRRGHIKEV